MNYLATLKNNYVQTAALAALLLIATPLSANALSTNSTLDQSQLSVDAGTPFEFTFTSRTNYPLGQSFTAGLDGVLSEIDLFSNGQLNNTNNVNLQIRAGDGVNGSLLGSTNIVVGPNSFDYSINQYKVPLDVSNLGIKLTRAIQYTFLITQVTGPGDLAIRGILQNTQNPYASGRAYFGDGYGNQPSWDLAFQTRVADSTPVPFDIPGGATFPTLGSLLALGVMRKARKFTANKQLANTVTETVN
jgi:hypothetical protein